MAVDARRRQVGKRRMVFLHGRPRKRQIGQIAAHRPGMEAGIGAWPLLP